MQRICDGLRSGHFKGKEDETEDIIEKEADEMTRNGLIPKRILGQKTDF
jgi:hypothetical protein